LPCVPQGILSQLVPWGFKVFSTIRFARNLGVLVIVLSATYASAATHTVPAGGDLQAALDLAQPGDVIELEAGATYTGNFRLPVKTGATFIVIRTGGVADQLPGPGTRINKAHAPLLAKIRSGNTAAALATVAGSHHWRVELVEFLANANGAGDIITLGAGASQTDVSQLPHDLVFDRVYVHGDPAGGQKRGIALNCGRAEVLNSYFEDFKMIGQDAQAMGGWNGTGPFLIENNYTEAAGQNVIFGGSDPSIPGLVPSDITVRRNVFTKPLSWRNERWQVKNAFELKNARRVLVEGNVIENVWSAAQTGYAVLFTVRNQDGRGPWSVVEDVTFRYNIIRHAGGAINVLGYDNIHPSQQTKRLQIAHNLVYDVDKSRWGGTGDFIQLGAMPSDISIENNTVFHGGTALRLYGGKTPSGGHEIERLVFRNNAMKHNEYGIKGDGMNSGHSSIAKYLPGSVVQHNILAGGPASQYPADNYFPSVAEFEAQFVDAHNENFALVAGSQFVSASSTGAALGADLNAMQRLMDGTASAPAAPPTGQPPGALPWFGRLPGIWR
jgi:hypothetical protein